MSYALPAVTFNRYFLFGAASKASPDEAEDVALDSEVLECRRPPGIGLRRDLVLEAGIG